MPAICYSFLRFVGGGEYITLERSRSPSVDTGKQIDSRGRTLCPPRNARYHVIV